jgi:hypothetical protein
MGGKAKHQLSPSARNAYVKETALFLDSIGSVADRMEMGQRALLDRRQENDREFQPLRAVQCHDRDVVAMRISFTRRLVGNPPVIKPALQRLRIGANTEQYCHVGPASRFSSPLHPIDDLCRLRFGVLRSLLDDESAPSQVRP